MREEDIQQGEDKHSGNPRGWFGRWFRKAMGRAGFSKGFRSLLLHTLLVFCAGILASCATGPRIVDHSFGFNAVWDSPGIEVLDYRYGESKNPGARPPDWALQTGRVAQGTNTNGPMRVGDSLYVKWKIKSTGEIYQDTVDLRNLPISIIGQRVYFIVSGSKLHVYLISLNVISTDICKARGGFKQHVRSLVPDEKIQFIYCDREIVKIYPVQRKL